MTRTNIKTKLHIRGLELQVFLGWPKDERIEKQTILLDLNIHFPVPPKACESDNLDDTFCYSLLSQNIQERISDKVFHLVEYLSREIYLTVKSLLPAHSTIEVNITKHPHIIGLTNGICFSYGDA